MEDKPRPRVGVGIMVFKNNKVLLGKRHPDPKKASSDLCGEGTWTMPGGKLDFGEELKEAAAREAFEETGIVINGDKTKVISVTNDTTQDKHYVTIGFICGDFKNEPKVMEPEEITEWTWFSLDNLPTPIYPPSLKIIKNFLAKEIYKN